MYQRDIAKLPVPIDRTDFIELVFDIGREHRHGYDTIVASVQIGDWFVNYKGERNCLRPLTNQERLIVEEEKLEISRKTNIRYFDMSSDVEDECINKVVSQRQQDEIMDKLVPQVYSTELACVVTLIACKCNEDFNSGYCHTDAAVSDTMNCYVVKMEWEIFDLLGFGFKVYNFISLIGTFLETPQLGSVFWDISKDICLNQPLLTKNPQTVVLALLILGRRGQLRAVHKHKERMFQETMKKLAHEYELDIRSVLQAYIQNKT